MDEKSMELYGKLVSAVEQWCLVFLKGGSSPVLTDGQELNACRREIKQAQDEMTKCGYWVPPQLAELPPEMDERYMKEADRIKEEAQAANSIKKTMITGLSGSGDRSSGISSYRLCVWSQGKRWNRWKRWSGLLKRRTTGKCSGVRM